MHTRAPVATCTLTVYNRRKPLQGSAMEHGIRRVLAYLFTGVVYYIVHGGTSYRAFVAGECLLWLVHPQQRHC